MKSLKKIEVYTDGACRGNPGPGGWGAFLKWNDHEKEIYGGEAQTTNNRMELLAAIRALECLKQPCEVILHTDSSYLKNGITQWIRGWKAKGWRTANKAPVKNQDLWQSLDKLTQTHQIDWRWVRGHAGDPGNERADRLANKGVDQVMSENP